VSAVRLIEERRFDPPRPVQVEQDGRWWPGVQHAWRLCDDGRGGWRTLRTSSSTPGGWVSTCWWCRHVGYGCVRPEYSTPDAPQGPASTRVSTAHSA
jgi:hypothetical protein